MSDLVIAAVQMTSGEDVDANLERCARAGPRGRDARARWSSVCPRTSPTSAAGRTTSWRSPRSCRRSATDEHRDIGPILSAMRALALKAGVWLLLGGFPEKWPQRPTASATRPCCSIRRGRSSAIYRKMHLFDVDVPGGKRFRESDTVEPGGDVVVAPTPWGGLGLSICYDLRFPELYRAHGGAGGAHHRGAVGVHARDRQGSLARAAAGARDREPGLRDGAGAVRRARPDAPQLRPRAGRRSVGRGHRRVRRPGGLRARAPRLRATRTRCAPPSPASTHRRL